ncbi:MAG: asparaginase [Planctomycetes bacterium]|nr:asparaginase [Planctomycetota bacterium]
MLARLGLEVRHLQCGPQPPGDPEARAQLKERGERFTSLHNNCSGKHAGFLALARHLGAPVESYLDSESAGQRLVRRALVEVSGVRDDDVTIAIDGCSAPTFRLPLAGLATAYARIANPAGLATPRRAACERMLGAVERFPELIAGRHERLCTDLARISRGRLFPKIGAEAVYAIGVRGTGRGLALKIDDGGARALNAVVVGLLRRFGFATADELAALEEWEERRLKNWAGLEVGRLEVLV